MLSDCRITVDNRGASDFAFSARQIFRWSFVTCYASRNVLNNRECKITSTPIVYCDSAIRQHLLENEECAKHYNDAHFSTLATAISLFHLSVLEATNINSLQSILCRQKEFAYSLQISH